MSVKDLVVEAGRLLAARYGEVQGHWAKARGELVTEVDKEIERFLVEGLGSAYPSHAVFS